MHLNTRVIFILYTIYGTLFKGECRVGEQVGAFALCRLSGAGVKKRKGKKKECGDHAGPRRTMDPPHPLSTRIVMCTCPDAPRVDVEN